MKCLVTGASGFIGSELCQQLKARRIRLEQVGREAPGAEQLKGSAIIFHCAGIAHRSASDADYEQFNFKATIALAAQAAQCGVQRFVFISSVNASPSGEPYGVWKWRTEQALVEAYAKTDMSVVIVRPALVYGVGARANLQRLMTAVARGLPMPPPGKPRSMISLPDLCGVLCLMIDRDPGRGQVFCATDGQSYDLQRLYRAIAAALGKPAGAAWLPGWAWRLACESLDLLRGRPFTGDTYDSLFEGSEYSNAELCRALSWQPRYTVEDLMPVMVEALS